MSRHMPVAFLAALIAVSTTLAQTPEEIPTLPTPLPSGAEASLVHVADAPLVHAQDCCEAGAGDPFWWLSSDYLFGWVRNSPLPPLVTTSPPGTARAQAGVLGQPFTTTLFGDERVNGGLRNGIRIQGGVRFGPADELGVEAGLFLLETESTPFAISSTGVPILARPFVNTATGLPASVVVAFPGESTGSLDILARSGNLFGGHVDFTERFYDEGRWRISSLLGYRFLRFDEGLRIRQDLFPTVPPFVPGTRITSEDSFMAQNEFHGVDIGLRTEIVGPRWTLELLTKIAAGNVRREVTVRGSQTTIVPGADPVTSVGGVLALVSNIGARSTDDWIAVPEVGLNLGWQVRENVRLLLGYSLLYWEETARAGNQLDLRINPNLFPPAVLPADPLQPELVVRRSDLWVQMLNLGVEFRY